MSHDAAELRSIWSFLDQLEFTQGYVDAGGVRTRYVRAGSPDAPALVMVHGMGGSWENFIGNFAELSKSFNTYAFDLVGHGYSAKPPQTYQVRDYVKQLGHFIDAMGLKRVNLLGLSIGGWVSTRYTIENPDRVEKLIVLSAWGRPREDQTPEVQATGNAELAKRLKAVDEPTYEAMDAVFAGLIANPKDRMRDLLTLRLRLYQQAGMPEVMRNVFGGLAPGVWEQNMLTDDELKSVSRPTMVVACVNHPDIFLKNAHEYRALIPGVQWKELTYASHWPQWEEAEELNRTCLEFFNG